MPEVTVSIGGRQFSVACQDGEEDLLQSASKLLDGEAATLVDQIGRMPEARMLLMSGLMLADRTVGLADQLRQSEERVAAQEGEMVRLRASPRPAARPDPETLERLARLAERAETLADELEARVASPALPGMED